jgi:hypothetical protein
MSCDLDEIFRSPQVRHLLGAVQAARTG